MVGFFEFRNKGELLEWTNYWDSEHAQSGVFFVSWNAGCCRILVPDAAAWALPEMRTGREVIFTRGAWPAKRRDVGIELMFEDGSDAPFALHLGVEQFDMLPPALSNESDVPVVIYTPKGIVQSLRGRCRTMPTIPCMQPWGAAPRG